MAIMAMAHTTVLAMEDIMNKKAHPFGWAFFSAIRKKFVCLC